MSKRPDADNLDAKRALEQALLAIHGIADVLNAVGQCRDIVMPTNGLSYLGSELQRAYEEARLCQAGAAVGGVAGEHAKPKCARRCTATPRGGR
jgi:hypothetical protein